MIDVPSAAELIHLGMDTSVNEIVVARGSCCVPAMSTVTSPVTRLSRGYWAAGR